MGYKAIIIPDGHLRGRDLLDLVGFVGEPVAVQVDEAPGIGHKYIVTQKQFDTYQLLTENKFSRLSGSILVSRGQGVWLLVEEAIYAIIRGDYITEDFLNAVDGK